MIDKRAQKAVIDVLTQLEKAVRENPIDPSYNTGKIKGTTNLFYIGTPGDAYTRGKNQALAVINGYIEAAKKAK